MMRALVQRRNARVTFGRQGGSKGIVDEQRRHADICGMNLETSDPGLTHFIDDRFRHRIAAGRAGKASKTLTVGLQEAANGTAGNLVSAPRPTSKRNSRKPLISGFFRR